MANLRRRHFDPEDSNILEILTTQIEERVRRSRPPPARSRVLRDSQAALRLLVFFFLVCYPCVQLKLESESKDAFANAGKEAGLFVWRVEKNTVVPWPKELTGTFYSAHDYVVLRSHKSDKGLAYVPRRPGAAERRPIWPARAHLRRAPPFASWVSAAAQPRHPRVDRP